MKKILQIGMTANYGGIESFIMNVYRNIDRNKFQFDFINMETNNKEIAYANEIKELGGKIYRIPSRRENWIENRKELKKLLVKNKYNCVHNNVLTWSYSAGISIPLRFTNAKVIVHSHGSKINKKLYTRKFLNFLNRRYNLSRNIIRLACSKNAGKWLFGKRNFEFIPDGIVTQKYTFNLDIRKQYRKKFGVNNKRVFLHVGRLSYPKNHLYLLNWFKKINEKDKDTILFLVGDGVLRNKIQEEIRNLDLIENVKLLGIRKDISNLMFMSDIFLFPSLYEGLGMVLIEAQATGLPCIVSKAIQPEAKITNYLKTIDITKDSQQYVNMALNLFNPNRKMGSTLVKEAGYDISNTVNLLERLYSK